MEDSLDILKKESVGMKLMKGLVRIWKVTQRGT